MVEPTTIDRTTIALTATALVVLAGCGAEWLHRRRVRRIARLAFGPNERPALWARAAPALRVLSLGAICWDLVIASHGITDERAKAVTFTAPHYCSGGMIIAMDPAIRTGKDLAGKVVAVQTGTSYLENVQKVSSVKEVKNFPTDVDARSALNSRRVDAWVTDRFVAKAVVEKNPNAGFKLGDMLFIERIAAAVAKGNQPLADAWSQGLAAIQADGSYAELSKKYFNEDVRCH